MKTRHLGLQSVRQSGYSRSASRVTVAPPVGLQSLRQSGYSRSASRVLGHKLYHILLTTSLSRNDHLLTSSWGEWDASDFIYTTSITMVYTIDIHILVKLERYVYIHKLPKQSLDVAFILTFKDGVH
jgi:hypothetical protein